MRARTERAVAHSNLLALRSARSRCVDCRALTFGWVNEGEFLAAAIEFTKPRPWWWFW